MYKELMEEIKQLKKERDMYKEDAECFEKLALELDDKLGKLKYPEGKIFWSHKNNEEEITMSKEKCNHVIGIITLKAKESISPEWRNYLVRTTEGDTVDGRTQISVKELSERRDYFEIRDFRAFDFCPSCGNKHSEYIKCVVSDITRMGGMEFPKKI